MRLLNYDCHTNLQLTGLMQQYPQTDKPRELMAHLLAAQQIWLKRCQNLPAPGGSLWPAWAADTFADIIGQNQRGWTSFLETLNDFDNIISYKNLKGEPFERRLSDILAHLINHGTHHRAQIGQHLKAGGLDLPITDYIYYVKDQL